MVRKVGKWWKEKSLGYALSGYCPADVNASGGMELLCCDLNICFTRSLKNLNTFKYPHHPI